MQINKKKLKFPFVWFALSNRENVTFQKKVFKRAKIEGVLASIAELGNGNAKEKRKNMLLAYKNSKTLLKMDSGGFSFYRNNINPPPLKVLEEQLEYDPDVIIQLDLPLSAKLSEKERFKHLKVTRDNLKAVNGVTSSKKVKFVPTIHGWTNKELKFSIKELKKINDDPDIVSIGSLVPLFTSSYGGGKLGGLQKAFEIIKKVRLDFPGTPLHVLGVGGAMTPILIGLGVDSIDSTGWIKKAAFGCIIFKGTSDRFFHTNGFKKVKYRTGVLDDLDSKQKWEECECPMCQSVINRWGEERRFYLYGRKNHGSYQNKTARRYRATHNVSIQLKDIQEGRIAIKQNSVDEFIKDRLKNSNYRKVAEKIFNMKIPKGEKSKY